MAAFCVLLPALVLVSGGASAAATASFTVSHAFNHVRSKPWEDALFESLVADDIRLAIVMGRRRGRTTVPIASARQMGHSANYVVKVGFGSRHQNLSLAIDTGNDVTWIPCSGCSGCSTEGVDTDNSTSYRVLSCGAPECSRLPAAYCTDEGRTCGFNLAYGSAAFSAVGSSDTLTLGADGAVVSFVFACLRQVNGSLVLPQGLLGLGRGSLSLISQTEQIYNSTFSYCLPAVNSSNFSGSLKLGVAGQPKRTNWTPLLSSRHRPSLYYVQLVGIRVGRRPVDIPREALAFNAGTGAGTVIDTGTVFTRLVKPAYDAVRAAFVRRVRKSPTSLGGFDTCFSEPIAPPTITFHFVGANMTLPADSILIRSSSRGIACLAMAAAPDNVNSVTNVIGSMQQQNHRLLFDLRAGRLGVTRELCT